MSGLQSHGSWTAGPGFLWTERYLLFLVFLFNHMLPLDTDAIPLILGIQLWGEPHPSQTNERPAGMVLITLVPWECTVGKTILESPRWRPACGWQPLQMSPYRGPVPSLTLCPVPLRVKVKVAQSRLTLRDFMGYTVHAVLQARILERVAFPFSSGSSQPRDQTQVSHIAGGSLPAEPQGKPKNTEVGSLSLLQWIFLTQKLNRGLLHCRWILYQLNYQGSPDF